MPEPRGNNRAEAAGGSRGAAGRWRGGRRPAEGAERREPPPAPAERSGAGRAAAWRGAGRPPGTDRWSLPGGRPPARGQVSTAGPGRAEALPDPNLPPPPAPTPVAPGLPGHPSPGSWRGTGGFIQQREPRGHREWGRRDGVEGGGDWKDGGKGWMERRDERKGG